MRKSQATGWKLYTTPSRFAEKIEKKFRKLEMAYIEDYELPERYGRYSIIIISKLFKTTDKYPRMYNQIKTKPL